VLENLDGKAMAFDVESLNQSVLMTFAEPFTYKASAGDVLLQGIFDDKTATEQAGGSGFMDRSYSLQLLQATVVVNAIELRKTVTVRDVDYQIIDIQSDTSGMATLSLRRYT
jgi:hypothetical protein